MVEMITYNLNGSDSRSFVMPYKFDCLINWRKVINYVERNGENVEHVHTCKNC